MRYQCPGCEAEVDLFDYNHDCYAGECPACRGYMEVVCTDDQERSWSVTFTPAGDRNRDVPLLPAGGWEGTDDEG